MEFQSISELAGPLARFIESSDHEINVHSLSLVDVFKSSGSLLMYSLMCVGKNFKDIKYNPEENYITQRWLRLHSLRVSFMELAFKCYQ